ncbi:hypothetical protein M514_00753 [Trichuris suis]|uniref:Uncharacterized protein n=1 Tax=Trichuris suis TaxID=68888 RepID=A0A085MMT1_9BILA|nr:hypothetical protein M513_00753 [Trichuris suis]KFD66100.1 hypothetical protein M514_00753 [Trichuris suis]
MLTTSGILLVMLAYHSISAYTYRPWMHTDLLDQIVSVRLGYKFDEEFYDSENPCEALADLTEDLLEVVDESEIEPSRLRHEYHSVLKRIQKQARRSSNHHSNYAACRITLESLLDRIF